MTSNWLSLSSQCLCVSVVNPPDRQRCSTPRLPGSPTRPAPRTRGTAGRSGTCTAGPGSARPRPNSTPASKDGHEKTLDRVLNGGRSPRTSRARREFMASERSMPPARRRGGSSAWWLDRMLKTAHPLREKLTLFWHNHFATSNAKVQNARLHARPVPADAAARARQLPRAARRDGHRPGDDGLARHGRAARRASRTRTTPAS